MDEVSNRNEDRQTILGVRVGGNFYFYHVYGFWIELQQEGYLLTMQRSRVTLGEQEGNFIPSSFARLEIRFRTLVNLHVVNDYRGNYLAESKFDIEIRDIIGNLPQADASGAPEPG